MKTVNIDINTCFPLEGIMLFPGIPCDNPSVTEVYREVHSRYFIIYHNIKTAIREISSPDSFMIL